MPFALSPAKSVEGAYEPWNSKNPTKSGSKEIAVTSQYHFCSPTVGLPVCTPISPRIMPATPSGKERDAEGRRAHTIPPACPAAKDAAWHKWQIERTTPTDLSGAAIISPQILLSRRSPQS